PMIELIERGALQQVGTGEGDPFESYFSGNTIQICPVVVRLGRGLSNAEIAGELFMSVATVKSHVSRILARLGLNNRVQIALLAYDAGLLDGDE
ncbi:response regulator transcription factor, partial [Streptomyces sp. S6]